jgi:putative hemolysin
MKKTEKIALALTPLVYFISKLFTPIVFLLTKSTNGVLRMFGIDPNEKDEEVSEEEIRLMVDEGSQKGVIDEQEQVLIQNVFEFDDLTVNEFATHRTDIAILWMDDDDKTWEETIHETRHSIYPVCDDTIDNVVGVLSVKDYFRLRDADRQTIMEEAIRPAYFVPEGIHADVLFKQMKETKNHFAVVLDEYGGTLGMVTLEDILEELVGEIYDEHDEIINYFKPIDETSTMIAGNADVSDMFEYFGFDGDDDKFEASTVSGWVIEMLGEIPTVGKAFEYRTLDFEVMKSTVKRVLQVKLTILTKETNKDD